MPSCRKRAEKIVYLIGNCPGALKRWIRLLSGSNVYVKEEWLKTRELLLVSTQEPNNPSKATLVKD